VLLRSPGINQPNEMAHPRCHRNATMTCRTTSMMNFPPSTSAAQPQSEPNPQPQEPLSLQQRYGRAARDFEEFSALAASPNLSPRAAAWARNLARSAKASMVLGQKALEYQRPDPDPEIEKRLALYRLFRLPLPDLRTPPSK
jgi:hypothetical protein